MKYRKSLGVLTPYRKLLECSVMKYAAAGHFDPPPVSVGLKGSIKYPMYLAAIITAI